MVHVLELDQVLPGERDEVFAFYADAFNLEAITPPWLGFRVVTPGPIEMKPGAMIEYRLELHGIPVRWLTEIEIWEPGRRFVDTQVRSPYRLWRHTHFFEDDPREPGCATASAMRSRSGRWASLRTGCSCGATSLGYSITAGARSRRQCG